MKKAPKLDEDDDLRKPRKTSRNYKPKGGKRIDNEPVPKPSKLRSSKSDRNYRRKPSTPRIKSNNRVVSQLRKNVRDEIKNEVDAKKDEQREAKREERRQNRDVEAKKAQLAFE